MWRSHPGDVCEHIEEFPGQEKQIWSFMQTKGCWKLLSLGPLLSFSCWITNSDLKRTRDVRSSKRARCISVWWLREVGWSASTQSPSALHPDRGGLDVQHHLWKCSPCSSFPTSCAGLVSLSYFVSTKVVNYASCQSSCSVLFWASLNVETKLKLCWFFLTWKSYFSIIYLTSPQKCSLKIPKRHFQVSLYVLHNRIVTERIYHHQNDFLHFIMEDVTLRFSICTGITFL